MEKQVYYKPNENELSAVKSVYDSFDVMLEERNKQRPQFNDRTLKEYIDDSQKRLNSYVPTREEQGKEDWQANTFNPVTRNKFKAILASIALETPPVNISAQNESGDLDTLRAEVTKHLVNFSYQDKNPEIETYFEAWENAEKGTCIVYEGCEKITRDVKTITSVDLESGDVEFETERRLVKDDVSEFVVPVEDIYIKDFSIFDIQEQPEIIWIKYYSKDEFEDEFGSFKNAKFVKDANTRFADEEKTTFYTESWLTRTQKQGKLYEVVRYYRKSKDEYRVIANGVLLLDAPLLWQWNDEKVYPFAKTVFELINPKFFYGNSLPNTTMGEQDVINQLYNMALDKTYRSMVPYQVIGMVNKDDFDQEDEIITHDTKIYLSDINQHRFEQVPGIGAGEIKMLDIVGRGLDMSTVDANQQGVANRGVTAREIVVANENAKKLKGAIYMFLSYLAVQKVRLRIVNILLSYTLPKVEKIIGEKGEETLVDTYRKFKINNAELSNGSVGTIGISMYGSREDMPNQDMLRAKEDKYSEQGMKYEEIAIVYDYLSDIRFDVKINVDDFFAKDPTLKQAKMIEKVKTMATFFPQYFQLNQEMIFKDLLRTFDDDPDKYTTQIPHANPLAPQEQQAPAQPNVTAIK